MNSSIEAIVTVLQNEEMMKIFSLFKKNSANFNHLLNGSTRDIDFQDNISKLSKAGLIELKSKKYQLTPLGENFLKTVKIVKDVHNVYDKLNSIGIINLSEESIKEEVLCSIDSIIGNEPIREIARYIYHYNISNSKNYN
jgi:predicted transcriptional regulator